MIQNLHHFFLRVTFSYHRWVFQQLLRIKAFNNQLIIWFLPYIGLYSLAEFESVVFSSAAVFYKDVVFAFAGLGVTFALAAWTESVLAFAELVAPLAAVC